MMRGYLLEQDLRLLINNPKYSDLEILCGDNEKLYACRAILAARSEVFNSLLYNGMKESYENQVYFPEIYSSGMKIILEYIYTGSISEYSLTKDNVVEAFYAADYFQLLDLHDFIIKAVKFHLKNYTENYSPELLSKIVDIMPLSHDNILLNLLVEAVAIMPLNTIEFGRLSIAGLQYLLSCTHGKPFSTPEYEVFRYGAILAAKQVSNDAYEALIERLPTLEQIGNSAQVENKTIIDHQRVIRELDSLIKFIDFSRIKGKLLTDIIYPLEIIPDEIILNVYRQMARSKYIDPSNLNEFRGMPVSMYTWDESSCGPNLIIEDNGNVVQAPNDCKTHQSVRAKITFENEGIFEWDIILEKACNAAWVGVCASENFNYKIFSVGQPDVWLLGSSGYSCSNDSIVPNYCLPFGDGTKITVHLDMNRKICTFTINNGTRHSIVPGWDNLPSKLYPVVGIKYPGRFRIQHHQKS